MIQRLVTALLVLLAVGFAVAGIDLTLLLLGLGSIPVFMDASAGTVMDATGAAQPPLAVGIDAPRADGWTPLGYPAGPLCRADTPWTVTAAADRMAGLGRSYSFPRQPARMDDHRRPEERLHATASMGMSHDHRLRRRLGMRISSKRTGGGLRVAATVGSRVRRLLALDTRKEAW